MMMGMMMMMIMAVTLFLIVKTIIVTMNKNGIYMIFVSGEKRAHNFYSVIKVHVFVVTYNARSTCTICFHPPGDRRCTWHCQY